MGSLEIIGAALCRDEAATETKQPGHKAAPLSGIGHDWDRVTIT
jgi:hypothetical protein